MLQKIKKHPVLTVASIVLCTLLLWIFMPRNLGNLLIEKDSQISKITLTVTDTFGDGETEKFVLDSDMQKDFIKLLNKTYVYRNPFEKKFVNSTGLDNSINIFIEYSNRTDSSDVPPYAYLFTDKIISVDSTQYCYYKNSFLKEIETFIS